MKLIAALVGCFALIGALTIALQGYTHGSAALRHALMLCDDVREFERLVDEYADSLRTSAANAN